MKLRVEVDKGKWTVEASECADVQAARLINEINELMDEEGFVKDIRIDNDNTVPDVGMILARWLNPGDVFTVDEGYGYGAKRYICLEYINDGGFVKAIREDVDKSFLGNDYRCVWQNIEDCEALEIGTGYFLLNYEEAKKYLDVPGFVIDKDWWLEDRTAYLPSNKKGTDPFFCLSAKNVPHCMRLAKTFDADKLVNRVKKA